MLADKPCSARATIKSQRNRAKQKTKVEKKARAKPMRRGIRRDELRSANHPAIAAAPQYGIPSLRRGGRLTGAYGHGDAEGRQKYRHPELNCPSLNSSTLAAGGVPAGSSP